MALQNGKRGSHLTLAVVEQDTIVQIGFPTPDQYALELLPATGQCGVVGPGDEFFPGGGGIAIATQGCRKHHAFAGKVFDLLSLFELAVDNGFESPSIRRQCQSFRGEARGQRRRRLQLAIQKVQQWLHLG